ncbi:lytic transglycosylase domain-containing protein [Bradyrhizobium sp. LB14.3]|uniref:lytic transglycosylase domain-containing protein n=1 Tax=Bradyrhizobium sp. LB14.3 TaxID=3156328 RepID=UPI003395E2B4
MQVESGGNAHAISPRGALGLMQIMPATWVELSARYGLGIDPFDPQLAQRTFGRCSTGSDREGFLRPTMRDRSDMTSIWRQVDRFQKKRKPM